MRNKITTPVNGERNILIKYITQIMVGILFLFLSNRLLKEDFAVFLRWWFALLLLGITFLPLSQKIFSSFHDNGYLFSKTIGLALSGYLMWLFSSVKLMKFTSLSCVMVVALGVCFNLLLFARMKTNHKKLMFTSDKLEAMVKEELLFLALFLIWTYIRGFKPEAYGTEKFMDYGFMTAMMRAEYMPPRDLWFAGSTINYYYVGQYMATFMTKLSFVTVNTGYNLMLMTLAAFAFLLPYSLIFNVTKHYLGNQYTERKKIPAIAGLLSGAGVSLAGNMHFPLYYWVIPILRTLLGTDSEDGYWFPDSTRYIGYDPDTTDKTIHEFPGYSFVLGDLHAHVINIIFVLTVLGILFAWLMYRKKSMENILHEDSRDKPNLWKEIFNPYIILIGFFIGLFHTTNFWDFPIYYVVAGAVILFSNAVVYRVNTAPSVQVNRFMLLKAIWVTAAQGITIILTAKLTALPFTLNFVQISTEIRLAAAHTPLYQLIILWGLPVILVSGLLIELISKYKRNTREMGQSEAGMNKNKRFLQNGSIIRFLADLNISELFIVILGLCGIGLVIIPELIYVLDIYSGDYKRANTMFKLTYQAFIMFGICSGFIFVKFLKTPEFHWQRKFAVITLLLFLSSLWYSKVAVQAWYGNVLNPQNYKGLDEAAFLETVMPDDYLATNWLNDNIEGTPVILEANGDSYSDYERVSVITGLPTVLGWYVHEWLWRGGTDILDERAAEIQNIYTSTDTELVNAVIDKYQIEYIYVGKLELDKYTTINDALLKSLGEVVFMSPATESKPYETYIVHVEPKG